METLSGKTLPEIRITGWPHSARPSRYLDLKPVLSSIGQRLDAIHRQSAHRYVNRCSMYLAAQNEFRLTGGSSFEPLSEVF